MLFAREGADVAVAYLNEDQDAEETKRAVENEGRRCILLPGDVADPAYCRDDSSSARSRAFSIRATFGIAIRCGLASAAA